MGHYDHFAFQVSLHVWLDTTKHENGGDFEVMLSGDRHFHISDMDASIRFYVEKLGFRLVSRSANAQEREEFAFLAWNDLSLELLQDQKQVYAKPEIKPPYCPHLAIQTDDMATSLAELKQKGVKIIRGPLLHEGKETWLYFADPDDNVLEYIQWLDKKK